MVVYEIDPDKNTLRDGGGYTLEGCIPAQSPEFESRYPLAIFLSNTAEWPKITHMLP